MTSGAGVMAATEPVLGPESAAPPREEEEGAGPSSGPERNLAGSSSTSEAPRPPPEPSAQSAAIPEAVPPPPAAASPAPELPLRPAPPVSAPRSPSGPDGPRGPQPGPETFRQRFRQFRYHDAAGPWEAFRQLRELSRQWLRPDIRTKEQIVEMLVQEQLLAILPEAARARRLRRRTDVRITG